jgi:DNA-directed RNA polymerase subunit N (RpoN/RPB10)
MIIPVRCFTCGKVLGDKWTHFVEAKENKEKAQRKAEKDQVDKSTPLNKKDAMNDLAFNEQWGYNDILNELGLNRICCRRHMLGHVNLIDII